MAWRIPTHEDLTSVLSLAEVEAYSRFAATLDAEPVPRLLANAAELVRSYCRSHGNVALSPVAGAIPEGLIGPAMDYAAYNLLKRFPLKISDARTSARDAAIRVFQDVAERKLTPESYGAAPDTPSGKVAVEVAASSRRRVTSNSLEGL